ncbi:hypothetical protein CW304_12340 [Bacillus sp. UFRGS-B20]|nr:hypothetical protein CW304_12340 [Bacillus sp. UFRGS-B20]
MIVIFPFGKEAHSSTNHAPKGCLLGGISITFLIQYYGETAFTRATFPAPCDHCESYRLFHSLTSK